MSEAISKAKLIGMLESLENDKWINKLELIDALKTRTFDLETDVDVKEIEDVPQKRKDEIAAMTRKELNGHAFLLEKEQIEYEREKRQLLTKLAEKEAEVETYVRYSEEYRTKLNQAVELLKELRRITPYGMYHEMIDPVLQSIKGDESNVETTSE